MKLTKIVVLATAVMALGLCFTQATMAGCRVQKNAIHGSVVRVDGTNVVIAVEGGKEVTVTTTDATEVKIDGADAAVADLAEGAHVTVPPYECDAAQIHASTKAHKGKGDGKGKGKAECDKCEGDVKCEKCKGKDKDHDHDHDHGHDH